MTDWDGSGIDDLPSLEEGYQMNPSLMSYLESLISTSVFSDMQKKVLLLELMQMKNNEEMLHKLNENQRDNIECGFNYSQGDILKKLNKHC